jgi:hypothetical protein
MPANPLSYISPHTIMGMVSKQYKVFSNGFQKNKNNIVFFPPFTKEEIIAAPQEKVFLNYLLQEEYDNFLSYNLEHTKSKGKLILSQINKEFFVLNGQKWREIREARNKFNKIVIVKTEPNSIDEIIELIDLWDKVSGEKYKWVKHSGYDRNFFNVYWNKEKDSLFSYFFYIDNKLVGYSIVSKLGNGTNFNYIIRKNDIRYRNLCLYIDYKTFEFMFGELNREFIVNWGAASGKILKYKKKFPLYKEVPTYFCKLKRQNEI